MTFKRFPRFPPPGPCLWLQLCKGLGGINKSSGNPRLLVLFRTLTTLAPPPRPARSPAGERPGGSWGSSWDRLSLGPPEGRPPDHRVRPLDRMARPWDPKVRPLVPHGRPLDPKARPWDLKVHHSCLKRRGGDERQDTLRAKGMLWCVPCPY